MDRLLPTLDQFETASGELRWEGPGTLKRAPDAPVERLCGLVMLGRALRHDIWRGRCEVSDAAYAKLPREPPARKMLERAYRFLDPEVPAKQKRCSSCRVTPGRNLCGVCGGTGHRSTADPSPCPTCDGQRFFQCSTCSGTTSTWACQVVYSTDVIVDFRRVVLPAIGDLLTTALRAEFNQVTVPPSAMRADWEHLDGGANPYRGRGDVIFHGFDASAVKPMSQRFQSRIRRLPSISLFAVLDYLWPFLKMQAVHSEQGAIEVVLAVLPGGPTVIPDIALLPQSDG